MIDSNLVEQLKNVFLKLENNVELVYSFSDHEDQNKLLDFLNDVAETSNKITVVPSRSNLKSSIPEFHLEYNKMPNGISFKGIPTGHEFTSLILAILNSDNKGKFPDEYIQNRIKKLKGPIELKTYISLTCENCPDVVQTLNLFAIIHGNFKHQMIDGAYVQNEISELNIQGVPSVISNNKLISAGKISLIELLEKLENAVGTNEFQTNNSQNLNLGNFDVVVIGGGPAGASAAIYSARKGLKTAVIADRIGGQVKDTKGIENFISIPYTEGIQLSAKLAEHMGSYPISVFEHRRVKNISSDKAKIITLESNESLTTKSIIIATGAKWRELNISGEKEYLGRGVAFCPHCDGPFYKNKNVAVVGGGNSGVEAAIDLSNIVKSVTLFEFQDALKADKVLVDKLKSLPNVTIITNAKTQKVVGDGQKVIGIEYQDRSNNEVKLVDLDGIFVQIGLVPNSQFAKDFVELNKFGEIIIDNKNRTNINGIYAAGDVTTTPFKQIIIAMGEGAKAALTAFEDLMLKQA